MNLHRMCWIVFFSLAVVAEAKQTDYYTMVNSSLSRQDCRGEGNQIVNGKLYGSNCKPAGKQCYWGIGNRNNCLTPCRSGACAKSKNGQWVSLRKPFTCQMGPLKGKRITQVKCDDVGGAINGNDVDVFQGLCRKTQGGVCKEFAEETAGTRNAVDPYVPGSGSGGRPSRVGGAN